MNGRQGSVRGGRCRVPRRIRDIGGEAAMMKSLALGTATSLMFDCLRKQAGRQPGRKRVRTDMHVVLNVVLKRSRVGDWSDEKRRDAFAMFDAAAI